MNVQGLTFQNSYLRHSFEIEIYFQLTYTPTVKSGYAWGKVCC